MFDDLKERIKKDKPFPDMLNIVNIGKLFNYGDLEIDRALLFYGVPLRIKDSIGKLYKLRVHSSVENAISEEGKIRLIPHILPKFYGRDRNYLLFDFLQGRMLTENESPHVFFQIGKMCGEVNRLEAESNKKQKLEKRCYQKINYFSEKCKISSQDRQRILRIYEKLTQKIEYEVVLGVNDIQKSNFMIDLQNKLHFVDEDGIWYSIKGYGFDKIIRRLLYPLPVRDELKEEYTKAFFLGYNSVNSSNFLNEGYIKLLTFSFLIDSALYLLRMGNMSATKNYYLRRLLRLE